MHNNFNLKLILLILLFFPLSVLAQFNSIRGFVIDASSGEPLLVASVVIEENDRGATTNLDGYFVINHIPFGKYTIRTSYMGYESNTIEVNVDYDLDKPVYIELQPTSVKLETVEVKLKREDIIDFRKRPQVSTVPLSGQMIRTMPSLGGEMDIMRALQTIPGVKSASDISTALHVRGGSPDQTLILMDHNTVYNPNHLFGLFSTFNADAVKHLDLMKGAFPAQYGGRSGSVLEVVMNDGNRKKYNGMASLGIISGRVAYEGPVSLFGKKGSFAGSYRRTYLDYILDVTRRSTDLDLPDYYFYDGNAKVNIDLTDLTTLTAAGYWGNDRMDFDFGPNDARLKAHLAWGNRTLSTRVRHALGRTSYISFGGAISRYRSKWGFSSEDIVLDEARERITDYSLKSDFEYFGWKDHQIKTGVWYSFYDTHFWEKNEDNTFVDVDTGAHNTSLYIQDIWRLNSFFELQYGVRGYYHNVGEQTAFDPRLAMVYHYNPQIRFKFGGGRYTQWMNVMSGGSEMSIFDVWFPVDESIDPCYTNQIVLGFEWDRTNGYEFTMETYYTDMHNVAAFRPMVDSGDQMTDAFVTGDGNAYGFEWMLRKKAGRLNGWLGYSLSWTERRFPPESQINEGNWFYPKWDRRHDFTVVANYKLNRKWDISGAWRYNTGQGFTQALGIYTLRSIGWDPDDESNYGRMILKGSKNNYRFPEDHRLDLNASYNHLFLGKPAKLIFSIYNAYSRRSYWFRSFNTSENPIEIVDAKLLPVLPLINYEVRF
ncbi:MAG: TonB-dependent receptor [Candidatus Hatepunaea meridiana]|nr:TonB-dependent receptor [Candidatus Hatepunaea meridiana]